MPEPIEMWRELGPQIIPGPPMDPEEFIEILVQTTGQSEGALLGILAEVDTIIIRALKIGRRVKLPNGMRFRPSGKRDGTIVAHIEYDRRSNKRLNNNPRVKWKNAKHIGLSDEEMYAVWNEKHPDRPFPI
ncbi:MAG: hypothetical protein PVF45_01560 [Anaerolineae bacterium]|jgi:hypothetical protein